MRETLSGRVVAVVTSLIVAASFAGCQQQQQSLTPGQKQARLLAAENIELKERLADQQKQRQADQQQYVQELGEKQQELVQCRQRIAQLQKEIQEGIAQRVNDVTAKVMDENARLRKEMETVTAQNQKLQNAVEQLKAEEQRLNAEIEKLKAPPQPAEPNQS
jgi:chromosome segregation ATPase